MQAGLGMTGVRHERDAGRPRHGKGPLNILWQNETGYAREGPLNILQYYSYEGQDYAEIRVL